MKTSKKIAEKRIVLPVFDNSGKEVEKIELDHKVFDARVSKGSIYRAVHNYLANRRSRAAATKTRSEVSGSGRKPWRQKGTGRARVGSVRTPLWRHGGVVFGPHPRDFSYSLPKKIKKLALKSALNDRALNNEIVVLNALILESYKTKALAEIIKKLKLNGKTLLVISSFSENIIRAVRNISDVRIVDSQSITAYDVVSSRKMLITKDALHAITERLK